MLTITNGRETRTVTKGAYREYFKPNGWELVDETPSEAAEEPDMGAGETGGSNHTPEGEDGSSDADTGSDGDGDSEEDQDPGEEISLEKMSDMELKQYAALLDIKTNNMSRKKLIEAIQAKQQK